jgi:hypothetical protein
MAWMTPPSGPVARVVALADMVVAAAVGSPWWELAALLAACSPSESF